MSDINVLYAITVQYYPYYVYNFLLRCMLVCYCTISTRNGCGVRDSCCIAESYMTWLFLFARFAATRMPCVRSTVPMNKLFGKQEKEEKSRGGKEKESKSARRQAPPSPPSPPSATGQCSPQAPSAAAPQLPAGPTATELLEAAAADMRKPRWNFHCQLAHGSPTGTLLPLVLVLLQLVRRL